ncbi:oxysterol-binding protein 1 [Eurytemora carolleeae]|uniref:oxysterol-binding protein 1 n=1 Tax=Eurytemora carolleeae TaxID=1294199 RepID=UPI000C75BF64|nr:oxysterol-binding protein 1 [Eurytemora carolleeae]|eukprot:XP_023322727.1 oxysterol-binding protein 1-like [Eurytemora affinis]
MTEAVATGDKKPDTVPETKGWLFKWTNYIKGYQKRWFVLQNGLLSYYRNQAEMAHTCRGTISLHGAIIHTEQYSCNFVVSNGGGTQTFHLRAANEVERQKWVTALELAKAKAIQLMESDDEEEGEEFPVEIDKQELNSAVKTMLGRLEELKTCHDLIEKHGHALQRSVAEVEGVATELQQATLDTQLNPKLKILNERATLFKITSNAMMNACNQYLELTQTQGRKWQRLLAHEREQRLRLEEMVEQLARQHSQLENQCKKTTATVVQARQDQQVRQEQSAHQDTRPESGSNSEDEDDFQDAVADPDYEDFTVSAPPQKRRSSSRSSHESCVSEGADKPEEEDEFSSDLENNSSTINVVHRRSKSDSADGQASPSTPVKRSTGNKYSFSTDNTTYSVHCHKFFYFKCLVPKFKNLPSKIPVPVNFSEPLSMLQRLVEDFEYSDVLDKAASCSDDYEQMAYVAAFTVSSYSTTAVRTGKPFNPLLGETFECDRSEDLGWRCISEQVLHHPPMVAQYCESAAGDWKCWQEFTMRSKFKGKYLEIEPIGITHLEFPKTGNHYTWRKVKTVVHNIVIGKLWIDNCGDMEVVNHRTNDKCYMKFEPYSYFGGTPKKVTGTVNSSADKVEWVLNGTWDSKLEGSKVIGEAIVKGKSSLEIGTSKVLWKRIPADPGSEKYYNFTRFTCELNELEDGVAPTDTRHRPDQRFMEEGEWDKANEEKLRLEEKQRTVRKQRELEAELAQQEGRPYIPYSATWYSQTPDPYNGGKSIHTYQGGYWESKQKQNWSKCPDIF